MAQGGPQKGMPMFGFVLALVLLCAGLALFIGGRRSSARLVAISKDETQPIRVRDRAEEVASGWLLGALVGAVVAAVGLVIMVFNSFYTQDVGESKVQVSWTGELVGMTTDPGLHFKAPWVGVRTFDVRNNIMAFVGPSTEGGQPSYTGNATTGPQITFQDREGVTGNMDITIRYSLDASSVLDIYREFQTQENFVNKVIAEGVRTEARIAPTGRGTLEVFNDRAAIASEILAGLEKRWAEQGIIIEEIAIQEIRYSDEVRARFDDAQAARIAIDKAEAEQEAAKVQAETLVIQAQASADAKVIEANGQAEANRVITESLTDEVLTQRYIDAIQNGTVFVVPEGSTPLIGTR